jgi:hypothetical protein
MNWKEVGRNQSWANQRTLLEFSWRDWGKTRKTSVRVGGGLAKIKKRTFLIQVQSITTIPISLVSPRYYMIINLFATCFTLVSCLAYSLTLKKEVTCSSETSVDYQRTTWHYIPEDRTLQPVLCCAKWLGVPMIPPIYKMNNRNVGDLTILKPISNTHVHFLSASLCAALSENLIVDV